MAVTVPANGVTPYGTPMSGTTTQRPDSGVAPVGTLYYDTTLSQVFVQTPTGWAHITTL